MKNFAVLFSFILKNNLTIRNFIMINFSPKTKRWRTRMVFPFNILNESSLLLPNSFSAGKLMDIDSVPKYVEVRSRSSIGKLTKRQVIWCSANRFLKLFSIRVFSIWIFLSFKERNTSNGPGGFTPIINVVWSFSNCLTFSIKSKLSLISFFASRAVYLQVSLKYSRIKSLTPSSSSSFFIEWYQASTRNGGSLKLG